ncbi:hypothetical protein [Streptococcus pneumoniae]|uniref:hypothetical protein n=1 Tax=Streptococcus pneumoniae TaxID=1313 RepID=UPI0005E1929E|nr:hypothetical protein [Streptococcus pneumoniae]CNA98541.1 Trk transporter membrane-spanning protein-K+ transport [Streptococcus pneumoniae]
MLFKLSKEKIELGLSRLSPARRAQIRYRDEILDGKDLPIYFTAMSVSLTLYLIHKKWF